MVKAIYMKGETIWRGVDIEDGSPVDLGLYELMLDILKQYFCGESSSEEQ